MAPEANRALDPPAVVAGPTDTVIGLGEMAYPLRLDPACRARVWIVVHRGFGVWTHLYTELVSPKLGRRIVHLRRVLAGERIAETRLWARGRAVPPGLRL